MFRCAQCTLGALDPVVQVITNSSDILVVSLVMHDCVSAQLDVLMENEF